MTCHWIDPKTLERGSCLVAIKRMQGSHTNDVLAKAMETIFGV